MARPKRTLPKSLRHNPTLDELEEIDTADWANDCETRERREDLKFKRAQKRAYAAEEKKRRPK